MGLSKADRGLWWRRAFIASVIVQMLLAPVWLFADHIPLTLFSPNTPIRASEVNSNFSAIGTAVHDLEDRTTALEQCCGVAFLKDVHLPGAPASGGDFVQDGWRTRPLNVIEPAGTPWVTLSANQFTLATGTYVLEARLPAFLVGQHQARLWNVTEGRDQIVGTSEHTNTVEAVQTHSLVAGIVTVASPTVFEIRHACDTTKNGDGFGTPLGPALGTMETEVYAVVKLTKVE